ERDYGAEGAQAIMRAHLSEAAIDLTPRDAEASVPDGLEVTPLANGSRRLASGGAITALPGFSDGAWWVQDAVASLPARLLGDVQGKRVLDACAAPGGKTLQLAAAGAQVISADISSKRLRRVRENLARTNLTAEVVRADLTTYAPDTPFDAILLDAPCSATGTIRRHPDIPFLKTEADINTLVELQARLIRHLATLVQPGGRMVYCVCSLQKVEGEAQVSSFLDDTPEFTRVAVPELLGQVIAASPDDISAPASDAFVFDGRLPGAAVTAQGDLRTLPSMAMPTMNDSAGGSAGSGMARGVDGFYAAILERAG
ncbi:MAG: RsmB/NOP family class I SAM-dependent RNA methyltransferase, partial [Pseudomonadota bacterium]